MQYLIYLTDHNYTLGKSYHRRRPTRYLIEQNINDPLKPNNRHLKPYGIVLQIYGALSALHSALFKL